jgi:hypothetical protein
VHLARADLGFRNLAGWERLAAAALALPAVALLLPALIYMINGYASEMTALFAIGIAALGFEQGLATGSVRSWALFCAGCVAAWFVRYQLGALPLIAVAGAMVLQLRKIIGGAQLRRACAASAVALAVSLGSVRLLASVFPTSGASRMHGGIFLQDSIQGALRCRVRLYDVDCSSRRGRAMIRKATCTDLINDRVPLGRPVVHPYYPLQTFQHIGALNTLKWLALAPLGYLRETYYLDHESFGFDRHIRVLNVKQRELAPYAALLPPAGQMPSRAFAPLVRYLKWTYAATGHHWLCGASLLVSALVITRGRRASAVFLGLAAIATYLSFSYLQPKAPLRYLMTIALLGVVAGWSALVNRAEARAGAAGVVRKDRSDTA